MKHKNMAKLIFYFCIVPLIFFAGFNLNRLSSNNQSPVGRQDYDSTSLLDGENYLQNNRTRKEVLLEMRTNGWLDGNYSEWFVSPQGVPSGSGKIDSPVDLETAFVGGNKSLLIKPGDVVWLRGGIYRGSYTVKIGGTSERPIHIRQYPGERAILDKSSASRKVGALNVRSSYVWFWDFEVANSFRDRQRLDSDGRLNPWRGSGINVWAANTKYINLVIHDNGHGIGVWNEDGDVEIYGCLIFNNGNNKKEHGIYAHNKTGTHRIANNIVFNNSGYGLHIYADSVKRSINGFDIENNTIFENGSLMNEDQVADQILVGGVEGVPAGRIRLLGNVVYTNPEAKSGKSRGIRLGYRHQKNSDVKLLDNLVIGKIPLKILWWDSVEACRNTIISLGRSIEIKTPANLDYSNYTFAQNTVLSNGKTDRYFVLNGEKTLFDQWHRQINYGVCHRTFGSDVTSDSSQRVFVNQNKYDKTRAYVTIYNGDRIGDVSVDLSGFLEEGKMFDVWDVQNYFGEPVLSGVYDGKPIQLPLAGEKMTPPIGETEQIPVHTGIDFSVFVVQKTLLGSNK